MVTFSISHSDARPIYQQIIDEVRRAMVIGTLKADDALPSVRQLAADLRINPNTVQQAYRELEREGLAYVRRGLGTFVAELRSADAERRRMARALAQRTLTEAYRQGLSAAELVDAIREAAEPVSESEEVKGS